MFVLRNSLATKVAPDANLFFAASVIASVLPQFDGPRNSMIVLIIIAQIYCPQIEHNTPIMPMIAKEANNIIRILVVLDNPCHQLIFVLSIAASNFGLPWNNTLAFVTHSLYFAR